MLSRAHLAAVCRVLEGIPEDQRPLLAMAAAGMSDRQIATRLGTRAGAARTRLHRARRSVHERLGSR